MGRDPAEGADGGGAVGGGGAAGTDEVPEGLLLRGQGPRGQRRPHSTRPSQSTKGLHIIPTSGHFQIFERLLTIITNT